MKVEWNNVTREVSFSKNGRDWKLAFKLAGRDTWRRCSKYKLLLFRMGKIRLLDLKPNPPTVRPVLPRDKIGGRYVR